MTDDIDDLFAGTNVVGTSDVAATLDLSEADARTWAIELDVAKIGSSFAWTQPDVEALADELDALGEEEEDDDDDDSEDEDDDEDDEDDDDE